MTDYRVNLDIYNGPLDLLLYLIRREEIDIHDIPVARITEQYCAYVDMLKRIDPDLAGDFLVMAATLLEIKTRMLLPRPERTDLEQEPFDPRSELVRQLLQYKAFKDAAGDLREQAARQMLRFGRRPPEPGGTQVGADLEDVQIWDLVEAFNAIMAAIGRGAVQQEIIYDDTPVELHMADILDRLTRDGNMTFRQVFVGRTSRTELVGLFLALLELVRRQSVFIEQSAAFGEIYIFLNPSPPPPARAGADGSASTGMATGTVLGQGQDAAPASGTPPAPQAGPPQPPPPAPGQDRPGDDGRPG
jgi:segregation and condensation protein A